MPKTVIDYSNTIFYKIRCKNPDVKDVYIGHTINFVERKRAHKHSCTYENNSNYNCKVYNIIRQYGGWDNWKMEIIAFHECEDQSAARKLEQKYFEEHNATLNSIEPLPKPKAAQLTDSNIMKKKTRLRQEIRNVNFTTTIPPNKFGCDTCSYYTNKHSSYIKHTLTTKHKTATNVDKNLPKSCPHVCKICLQEFSHSQGLLRHNQKNICKQYCVSPSTVELNNIHITGDIMMLLEQQMTATNEFKQMVIEQTNQMLELVKNAYTVNNDTTTYTT